MLALCKTIAGDIKLSPATVRRAIKDLKKAGLIETEQRYRSNSAKVVCCLNYIHLVQGYDTTPVALHFIVTDIE